MYSEAINMSSSVAGSFDATINHSEAERRSVCGRISKSSKNDIRAVGTSDAAFDETRLDYLTRNHQFNTQHIKNSGVQVVSGAPNASMAFEPKRDFATYVSAGPFIGLVSTTTARIVVETSDDDIVNCYLTDENGNQHGVTVQCHRFLPAVFFFEGLEPETRYRVSFSVPVPGLIESFVRTQSKTKAPKIAVVSSSDMRSVRKVETSSKDMWRELYSTFFPEVEGAPVEEPYTQLLLLGNVFNVDWPDYTETRGGRVAKESNHCVFLQCLELVKDLSPNYFGDMESRICNMMRTAYREVLTAPTVRHVLANVPVLSIPGDLEIGCWMDDETEAARKFVHDCAYRVYNEYVRALFDAGNPSADGTVSIHQGYHFHRVGYTGYMMLDTKAYAPFHRANDVCETPFLGARQWNDIIATLSDNGYFANVDTLIVCSTSPIVLASERLWINASSEKKMELLSTWCNPDGIDEASLLLTRLFDWKQAVEGRNVVLACGTNFGNGGVSEIRDSRYRGETITQLTAGSIAPYINNKWTNLDSSIINNGLGVYHSFSHKRHSAKTPSFGTIKVQYGKTPKCDMNTL